MITIGVWVRGEEGAFHKVSCVIQPRLSVSINIAILMAYGHGSMPMRSPTVGNRTISARSHIRYWAKRLFLAHVLLAYFLYGAGGTGTQLRRKLNFSPITQVNLVDHNKHSLLNRITSTKKKR